MKQARGFTRHARRGSIGLTLLFITAILALTGGICYYYYSSQDVVSDTYLEDSGKILRDIELSPYNQYLTFGDFMKNGALGKPEFTVKANSDYNGMSVFEKKNSAFAYPEKVKGVLLSLLQGGVLMVDSDKKGFLVIRDGLNWDAEKVKLKEAFFTGDALQPKVASGSYGADDLRKALAELLKEQDKHDFFGFIRFFFDTSIDGVLAVAVYSLDTREAIAYNAIPVHRSGDGLKGIRRVRSRFIDEILPQKIKFDAEFQALSFAMETPDFRLDDSDIDKCLTIFVEQLFDVEEKQ